LYLLHTMGLDPARQRGGGQDLAGTLEFEYTDGEIVTNYINLIDEVAHGRMRAMPPYDPRKDSAGKTLVAWLKDYGLDDGCVSVSLRGFNNPRPDKIIYRLRFRAAHNGNFWAVLGVTLSDRAVAFGPDPVSCGIPDNWGAAAVVYALVEGLAGVQDQGKTFDVVRLAPRWTAAGVNSAEVAITYPASQGYVAYRLKVQPARKRLLWQIAGSGVRLQCHCLLPRQAARVKSVLVNGQDLVFTCSRVRHARYVDFNVALHGIVKCAINYE